MIGMMGLLSEFPHLQAHFLSQGDADDNNVHYKIYRQGISGMNADVAHSSSF